MVLIWLQGNNRVPLELCLAVMFSKPKIANRQSGFQIQPVDEFSLV